MSTIKAPPVDRILVFQLLTLLFLSMAGLLLWGMISAYSLLIGGLLSALPNAFFARMAFSERGARATQRIVRNFYIGEAVKLVMMGAGFALAFVYIQPLNAAALFAGFILVHCVGLMLLIRLYRSGPGRDTN